MSEGNINLEETKLILSEWETVISTQTHFNEMIIKARTTGVSVVMGVYGAAALAVGQFPDKYLKIGGVSFHVSAAIIFFGLFLLFSIFVLDFLYYFPMLVGAVNRGLEIDDMYNNQILDGKKLFGMTTLIQKQVSLCRAKVCLFIFYLLPFLAGVISLFYLIYLYPTKPLN